MTTDETTTDETSTDETTDVEDTAIDESAPAPRERAFPRVLAFAILPALALLLAVGAGVLKWHNADMRDDGMARTESVQAARDIVTAMLSYQPDQVDQQLTAAQESLTGPFRDVYAETATDVVIPGAKQQRITAATTIPAAASVSADQDRAVALLFVNQNVTVGDQMPTDNLSSVRVTLEKVGDRWLISQFEPV